MSIPDKIKSVQRFLEIDDDGIAGNQTWDSIIARFGIPVGPSAPEWHEGKASSFADPADVAAFRKCKLTGKSDQECFKVGDNGIGKWGDDTTGFIFMCALPPEDWEQFGSSARGKVVVVQANGRQIQCELRDTMPRKKNIKNGAVIDLNPAAVKALGLTPPIMVDAKWRWA